MHMGIRGCPKSLLEPSGMDELLRPASHARLAGSDPPNAPGGAILAKGGDPDPKALARHGILWQQESPDEPQ